MSKRSRRPGTNSVLVAESISSTSPVTVEKPLSVPKFRLNTRSRTLRWVRS